MFQVGEFVRTKVDVGSAIKRGAVGCVTQNNHPKYHVEFTISFGNVMEVTLYDRELTYAAATVTNQNLNDWLFGSDLEEPASEVTAHQKAEWRKEGRCETCGEKRPMSVWGLLECEKCK